ncbi:MAG: ribbon-helix-helix domain-containing protein [Pseudomonadota bacterium]
MSLIKRSITIEGHATSVALEPAFWDELDRMADDRGVPFAKLVAEIDAEREGGLASALRLSVLVDLKAPFTS